ncbi:MAG TPA: lysylphosphatidylglycerol synthase transmembrane domain-containing protein, partial [Vicinamibacterales bacterium]|nr:lysylphosphatidylglycerol synthase transmembrane domain-containing protein [Vicinamibacterales bacterium]
MRARISTILRIAVAAGLTLWLLNQANPADVFAALRGVRWTWILATVALVAADRALNAYRWMALLRPVAHVPPVAAVMRVFFVSTFIGTFLPGPIGTDAMRTWGLAEYGVAKSQALASVLIDRLLGVVSILVAALAGLALAPRLLDDAWVRIAFIATAAGSLGALLFVFSSTVDNLIRRVLARAPIGLQGRLGRFLDALQAYRGHQGLLNAVLLASVGVQALRVAQAWMLGRSLGLDVDVVAYVAFVPVILLLMLLPISPSGLGVAQWGFDV